MNCPKCNSIVNSNDKFCGICGYNFNDQNTNQQMNEQPQTVVQQPMNNFINDEELINAYIGKKSDKLKKGFSVCTLLFGVIYVFYRKMWALGFIWILASLLISIFLPMLSILNLAITIVVACLFKQLYMQKVTKKVEQIKSENPGKTKEEILKICSKKGGITIIPIVISVLVMFLITFLATKIVLDIMDEARNSALENQQEYEKTENDYLVAIIIGQVKLAYSDAYINNKGKKPTKQQVREEFNMSRVNWNENDVITTSDDNAYCNVIINSNNEMTIECNANGRITKSDPFELAE